MVPFVFIFTPLTTFSLEARVREKEKQEATKAIRYALPSSGCLTQNCRRFKFKPAELKSARAHRILHSKLRIVPATNLITEEGKLYLEHEGGNRFPMGRICVKFSGCSFALCNNKSCLAPHVHHSTGRPPKHCAVVRNRDMPPNGVMKLHHVQLKGAQVTYHLIICCHNFCM